MGQFLYTIAGFIFLLIFLLGLYGLSVGGVNLNQTIGQITGPWPTVSNGKCAYSTEGFTGSCNVLDAAELGTVFVVAAIGSVLFRIGAVFYLFYQLFSFLGSFQSFPWIGWFIGLCLFIVAIESFKIMRSGKTS